MEGILLQRRFHSNIRWYFCERKEITSREKSTKLTEKNDRAKRRFPAAKTDTYFIR